MAIRRTREDKLQAKMRREEGNYSWQPEQKKRVKETVIQKKIERKSEGVFFWKDMRRTLVASILIVLILLAAWYFLRQ